jgi:tartrate-resistant acid phosphatase type 5
MKDRPGLQAGFRIQSRTPRFPSEKSGALILAMNLLSLVLAIGLAAPLALAGSREVPTHDHRNKTRVTVLLFGDSGTGSEEQYKVGRAMAETCRKKRCDLAIGMGDNFYDFGVHSLSDTKFETHFEMPYLGFGRFDFWMTLGNHDYFGSVSAQIANTRYSDMWRMPARHYAVPKLPEWLALYALDTNIDGTPQANAIRRRFCGKPGWKGIFGHHPVYSNGGHGDQDFIWEDYGQVMKDCGIQFYFGGHDHHQEHITGDGFELILQGAAGKLRDVKTVPYQPGDKKWQRFGRKVLGFGIASFTPDRVDVEFYDDDGTSIYEWESGIEEIGKLPAPPISESIPSRRSSRAGRAFPDEMQP